MIFLRTRSNHDVTLFIFLTHPTLPWFGIPFLTLECGFSSVAGGLEISGNFIKTGGIGNPAGTMPVLHLPDLGLSRWISPNF